MRAALNARYIITGDKALRDIEDYMGAKVVTPKEFLALQDPKGGPLISAKKYSP
jgi:predicted nucleic acid-binding protein